MADFARPPLALKLAPLRKVYYVGGSWSPFALSADNGTAAACPGVLPVVVFGAQGTTLRTADLQVQWESGRGAAAVWHSSALIAEDGVLVGLVGPDQGLTLAARGSTAVPMRMRFADGAPTGQWVTMAIGYEPVTLEGDTVPLPVGVSDPHLFQVVRPGGPQLARTGGGPATVPLAALSLLALGTGAALLLLSRRRDPR
jgi:hypothetical protein